MEKETQKKDFKIRGFGDFLLNVGDNALIITTCNCALIAIMGLFFTKEEMNGIDKLESNLEKAFSAKIFEEADLHEPCSKTTNKNLGIARVWELDHSQNISDIALAACRVNFDKTCPLVNGASSLIGFMNDNSWFSEDWIEDVYSAQFFCPQLAGSSDSHEFAEEASVEGDQDPDRVPQIFLRPSLVEEAERDPCKLVESSTHELIHTVANFKHDIDSEEYKEQRDWPYLMGEYAYEQCSKNPPQEWIGKIPESVQP